MFKLLELTFNNIGRFIEEQTINLENRAKLIQIDGLNLKTGGSSGAGKTTVIEALMYLLGISNTSMTVLQCRHTKKPMYVVGKFLINDIPVTIKRHKKDGLSIILPDETISGNSKLAEEKLDELIGIPRKLFKKIVYKEQKEGGFFLSMTAKESYNFLISVLGLEEFLNNDEKITNNIKQLTERIDNQVFAVSSLKESISEIDKILESKIEPTCSVTVDLLQKTADELKRFKDNLAKLNSDKQKELSKLTEPIKDKVDIDDRFLIQLRTQLNDIHKRRNEYIENHTKDLKQIDGKIELCKFQLDKIERVKLDLPKIGSQIRDLKTQQATLQHQAKCPTCTQPWSGVEAQNKLNTLASQINELINSALELKKITDAESECNNQMAKLLQEKEVLEGSYSTLVYDKQIEDFEERVLREQAKHLNIDQDIDNKYLKAKADFLNKINKIEDKYKESIKEIEIKINELNSIYIQQQSTYNNYEGNLKKYKQETAQLHQLLNEKKVLLHNSKAEQEYLKHQIEIAEEAKRLIKTYTLQIFQETLDSIGELATHILSHIPNTANTTIYFEGCKENKNGTLKDEVNGMLNMDGENNIPIKSFSGGERTAIDLAVDLAVADTIESRTGRGANFFIFDEPFDGLDNVCREQCLEILQQIDTNKKIIMVDHSDELKEMVSDVIKVVRNGENSAIE